MDQRHGHGRPHRRRATSSAREEQRRLREIRQIVLATADNMPVRVDDVVEGGPVRGDDELGQRGVVVGHQTRLGRAMFSAPPQDRSRGEGRRYDDAGQPPAGTKTTTSSRASCCCARAKTPLPALQDLKALIDELNNTPGRLLPGVKITALRRPHRTDPRDHRNGPRESAGGHGPGGRWCC